MKIRMKHSLLIGLLIALFYLLLITISFADNTNYFYDSLNRLIRVEYEDGRTVEYFYDEVGNLIEIVGEQDGCPDDPNKVEPGVCGCGVADIDSDGDGSYQCDDCDDTDVNTYPGADDSICDGVDNNCNGIADDEYIPTPTTCDVGFCEAQGELICVNGNLEDTCIPGTPTAETCNGIDDDCNGVVDDGIVPVPTSCSIGVCASTGELICENGTLVDTCQEGAPTGNDNDCNGIDENCNGTADENYIPTSTTCGIGACGATGELICQSGQLIDSCTPGQPATEICNNVDDDCDGTIDGITQGTTCGAGVCSGNTGIETCTAGTWGNDTCNPLEGASDEICDNLDNDCDGPIDEGLTQPTTCGLGVCAGNTGFEICTAGQWGNDTCDPLAGASDEICDGLDNDCNGLLPENEVDDDADGFMICQGDCNDVDAGINPDATEICDDGIDNNCNGEDAVIPVINEETISGPADPLPVTNGVANVSFEFTDANTNNTHTVTIDWGDGNISEISIPQGSRLVEDTNIYTQVGVYTITFTVTDNYCGDDSAEYRYIVIYDSEGGFVTGGGWINSPEDAYTANPSLTGKANFGFVSKYKKGATVPTGQTEFQFKVADLNFRSDTYDWLVIAGARAQYKGIGTINNQGVYKFMLTAIDADINENDSHYIDRFRVKIWTEDENGNEEIVYDNGLGADDLDDNATTDIGGGSIKIHKD